MTPIYRVRAVHSGWNGGPGLSTTYWLPGTTAVTSNTEASAISAHVRAAYVAGSGVWPGAWRSDISPVVDVIDDENGDLTTSYGTAQPVGVVGSAAGGYGPIASGLLLRLNTVAIVNSHRLRGRLFLGPNRGDGDADGTPNQTAIDLAKAFGNALLSATTGGAKLAVWHRPNDTPKAGNSPLGKAYEVTSTEVPDYWAVLRSRRN